MCVQGQYHIFTAGEEKDASVENAENGEGGKVKSKKKRSFWQIPFASKWAAKITTAEQAQKVGQAVVKEHSNSSSSSNNRLSQSTTKGAHKTDMEKLLGKWSR